MGRIGVTLARVGEWFSLTASVRRLERDAREILTEATLTLEKLNTLAARLARRDARAFRKALDAPEINDQPVARVVGTPRPHAAHKAEVRARIFAGGRIRPGGAAALEVPCDTCDDDPPPGV